MDLLVCAAWLLPHIPHMWLLCEYTTAALHRLPLGSLLIINESAFVTLDTIWYPTTCCCVLKVIKDLAGAERYTDIEHEVDFTLNEVSCTVRLKMRTAAAPAAAPSLAQPLLQPLLHLLLHLLLNRCSTMPESNSHELKSVIDLSHGVHA